MHILVAEDNADMRETIKSVLSAIPATFYQCGTGRKAIREYIRLQPDWVLMDIRMPELDGVRAMEIIKAHRLISDFDDSGLREEATRLNASGYVRKENLSEVRIIISQTGRPITDITQLSQQKETLP